MREGGIVSLYALENRAAPGFMPREMLVKKGEAFYAKRTTGINRRFSASGPAREYDYVIRCWNTPELPEGVQYAIPEDGKQYRIEPAERIFDQDAIDLTLTRLEDFYDVFTE